MIIEHELHILENVKFALCMEIDVGKYTVWIRSHLVYSLFVIYQGINVRCNMKKKKCKCLECIQGLEKT